MKVKLHGRNPRYTSEYFLSRSQAARFTSMVNDMATHIHGYTPGRFADDAVARLGKVDVELSSPDSEIVLKSIGGVTTLLRQSKKSPTTTRYRSMKGGVASPILPRYDATLRRNYIRVLDALPYHIVTPHHDVFVELIDRSARRVRVKVSETTEGIQPEHACSLIESEKPVTEKRIDTAKVEELQARIDNLLAGCTRVSVSDENNRPFASFLPSDKIRAQALESLCEDIADEIGGLEGLEAAIDELYENLNTCPPGMVVHAAKSFLTHYKPAREHLIIRSLEERQPAMVAPSARNSPFPR